MNKHAVSLALSVAAGATLSGCAPCPPVPGVHIYAALEASASLCAKQAGELDPAADQLTMYRLDDRLQEFSSGPAPDNPDALQETLNTELLATSPGRGTFPVRFWTTVATRAEADSNRVVIELYSDGDNDDETAAAKRRICAAVREISANPHVVSVCLFGVEPRNWAYWRDCLRPLGARSHLYSPSELSGDTLSQALEQARR